MEEAPLSVTVPLPGASDELNNATFATVEEFVVPSGSDVTAKASTSNVKVEYHQSDDMEMDMEELANFIQRNEIPEVSDNFAASVFSPDSDELAASVSVFLLYSFLNTSPI